MYFDKIICGDALQVLRSLPDNFVQSCITSPPYFGLRSYLPSTHPNKHLEIGAEATPEVYITRLVEIFREVQRVLRLDGTLWLNIADSYAGSWGNFGNRPEMGGRPSTQRERKTAFVYRKGYERFREKPSSANCETLGLQRKNLMLIPARLSLALQADGWIVRSDIIWAKSDPMPESVRDRPTKSYEHVYLLTKSPRYFYDAVAVGEPLSQTAIRRYKYGYGGRKNKELTAMNKQGVGVRTRMVGDREPPSIRNRRDVWVMATSSYHGAHFATMPSPLVEICILAGTSPRACEKCGTPWRRIVERGSLIEQGNHPSLSSHLTAQDYLYAGESQCGVNETLKEEGWCPSCTCLENTGISRCVVLDPFAGSGTVLASAHRLGRAYLGIELNSDYLPLIEERIDHKDNA
jgi:DNA modification methylase